MKNFVVLFLLFLSSQNIFSQHRITLKIKGLRDSTLYLVHHYEETFLSQDTAKVDASGLAIFTGNKKLPAGFYVVAMGRNRLFDLVLNDQNFSMETDTADYVNNLKITGSVEATLFQDFVKQANTKAQKLKGATASQKQAIYADLEQFQKEYVQKHTGTFTSNILRAGVDIDVPPLPAKPTLQDTINQSNYYFKHYWDNINLGDDRMLRTPFIGKKMDTYLTNISYFEPDTIIKIADAIIGKTPPKSDLRKYIVGKIAQKFIAPEIMGRENAYIHVAEKYIIGEPESGWDTASIRRNKEYVAKMKPVVIGNKILNMDLTDTLDVYTPLYGVKADYTLVMIYDPECHHCQETTKKLLNDYAKLEAKGVKVYMACGTRDKKKWLNFVREYKTQKFINVFDSFTVTDFANKFNTTVYPNILFLDKDKKILANKKLDTDQYLKMISQNEERLRKKK
jgi:thioredoxin-related protein